MSSESYVGLGVVIFAPAIIPLALAAAGVGLAGAAVYGGAKAAQGAYEEHKRKLVEKHGVEEAQLRALDQAVNEIARSRASLAEKIRSEVAREQEKSASTTAFGRLTASVSEGDSTDAIVEASMQENALAAVDVGRHIDFSDLFSENDSSFDGVSQSVGDYLAAVKRRISGLVAFTSEERGAQDRLLQRCNMLDGTEMSLNDVKNALASQVEELCDRLLESEAEKRRQTYLDYIAMCSLVGRSPEELSYEAMTSAISDMGEQYLRAQVQGSIFDSVSDSLAKLGLENVGLTTFNGEEGYLIVDEEDASCGIFMRRSDDNEAFLFTTVSSQEPSRVDANEKQNILSSAKRICEKKRLLFEELLPSQGVSVDVEYQYDPPSISHIHRMPQLDEYSKNKKAERTAASSSSTGEKHQEF